MRPFLLSLLVVLTALAVFAEDAPPVVGGGGATLQSLAGSDKLVTVVLKGSGATDPNLSVLEVGPNYFAVQLPNQQRATYPFASVQEIRVQDGKVDTKEFNLEERRSLKMEEQKVVDQAYKRAAEIYEAEGTDQAIKMRAAALLMLSGRKDAEEYLRRLASSNDVATELDAVVNLFFGGATDVGKETIQVGLQSGDLDVKRKAAFLAGLTRDSEVIDYLVDMMNDRRGEISAPAVRALTRLGYRNAIPTMLNMLDDLNEDRAEAAVYGLSEFGSPEIVNAVKKLVPKAEGTPKFRMIRVLYALDDPLGKKLMVQQITEAPTLALDAAIILAKDNNYDGMRYLTEYLKKRYNDDDAVIAARARAAVALIEGGDSMAVSHLQELLRADGKPGTKLKLFSFLAKLGKRRLIPLVSAGIENPDPAVALEACAAAIASAQPAFRDKLVDALELPK